jgi:glycosyltransferase involved in cell wall biosynthesis/organic radical activating enzyme
MERGGECMTPKVSIIVPCYKSEKYIRQCVDSILAQTFEDWEAIFIVDSPSSEMFKISSAYMQKDARLRFEVSATKTSPAKARNRGVAMSHGDYIAFLDADDWWYPEKLSKQVHYMEMHPEVEWCWAYATHHKGVKEYMPCEMWENPTADVMIPFQTVMIRRSTIDDIIESNGSLFDESLHQIDDYDLYLRLKSHSSFHFREPMAHYREHNGGITTSSSKINTITQQLQINLNRHQYQNVPRMLRLYAEYKARYVLLPYKNNIDKFIDKRHLTLQIEPTTRCNLVCRKCTRGSDTPIVDLQQETLFKLINNHYPVKTILLQGLGEPFMHPHFAHICKMAKENCHDLVVVTNGTLIDPDALQYITHVVVSIDTMDKHFAKETRSINYDLDAVKQNVIELAKRSSPTVAVNFVRTAQNFSHQQGVQSFCDEIGIPMYVTPVQNWYNPEEPGWEIAHATVMAERKLSGKTDRPFKEHCPFLDGRKFYYDAMGRRHPCCIRMRHNQIFPTYGTCRTCPE